MSLPPRSRGIEGRIIAEELARCGLQRDNHVGGEASAAGTHPWPDGRQPPACPRKGRISANTITTGATLLPNLPRTTSGKIDLDNVDLDHLSAALRRFPEPERSRDPGVGLGFAASYTDGSLFGHHPGSHARGQDPAPPSARPMFRDPAVEALLGEQPNLQAHTFAHAQAHASSSARPPIINPYVPTFPLPRADAQAEALFPARRPARRTYNYPSYLNPPSRLTPIRKPIPRLSLSAQQTQNQPTHQPNLPQAPRRNILLVLRTLQLADARAALHEAKFDYDIAENAATATQPGSTLVEYQQLQAQVEHMKTMYIARTRDFQEAEEKVKLAEVVGTDPALEQATWEGWHVGQGYLTSPDRPVSGGAVFRR